MGKVNDSVSVCRTPRMSDARYIAALERSNRALNRENRRLVRLRQEQMLMPKNSFTIYINTGRR